MPRRWPRKTWPQLYLSIAALRVGPGSHFAPDGKQWPPTHLVGELVVCRNSQGAAMEAANHPGVSAGGGLIMGAREPGRPRGLVSSGGGEGRAHGA